MSLSQYFQTLRPLRRIGKLRGIIEVPAFSVNCGEPTGCVHFVQQGQDVHADDDGSGWPDYTEEFTLEAWVKPDYFAGDEDSVTGLPYRMILYMPTSADIGQPKYNLMCSYTGELLFGFDTAVDSYLIQSGYKLSVNTWQHIAVTYSVADTTLKFYVNGVLVFTFTDAVVATLDGGNGNTCIGNGFGGYQNTTAWRGSVDEVRLWSVVRTDAQILSGYHSPRDTTGVSDVGLTRYVKFSAYPFVDAINGYIYSSDIISYPTPFDSDNNYPFRYGGSFIAGQFPIDTDGKPFSLRYPVRKPTTTVNYVPVIRWLDDDGEIIRYKLWSVDGFLVGGNPIPTYTGQKISINDPILEIWNIDGNSTVDNIAAWDLETSLLKVATSYTDVTPTTDATLTIDTSLAEPIPLTNFPLEFNTTQTY